MFGFVLIAAWGFVVVCLSGLLWACSWRLFGLCSVALLVELLLCLRLIGWLLCCFGIVLVVLVLGLSVVLPCGFVLGDCVGVLGSLML